MFLRTQFQYLITPDTRKHKEITILTKTTHQFFQSRAAQRQMTEGGVSDEQTVFEVYFFEHPTRLRQHLEPSIGKERTAGHLQGLELGAVLGKSLERLVGELGAVAETKIAEFQAVFSKGCHAGIR